MSTGEYPRTSVLGDETILVDPGALTVVRAVERHNCLTTALCQRESVACHAQRIKERGLAPRAVAIVLLNVDDTGAALADALMPGFDWQAVRDHGGTPFARGFWAWEQVMAAVSAVNPGALARVPVEGQVVVVMDHGTAEAFALSEVIS